jgi:hypothetical protein
VRLVDLRPLGRVESGLGPGLLNLFFTIAHTVHSPR